MRHHVSCRIADGTCVVSDGRQCAERRMIEVLRRQAVVAGAKPHAVTRWMQRQAGLLTIERFTRDGKPACCLPCIYCRQALSEAGLCWVAFLWDGTQVSSENAPPSVFTNRQFWRINGYSRRTY